MILDQSQINKISYTNRLGETSDKTIVVLKSPIPHYLTYDVSEMKEADQAAFLTAAIEYQEYQQLHLSKMFNFEDFVSMGGYRPSTEHFQMNYKRLNPENIS